MTEPSPIIAILDDEAEMRKALRRLLVANGFRVEDYECGNNLLNALSARPAACLVLDLHMPDFSGFDVLASVQAQQIATPVVVLTGHDEPGAEERARTLGAAGYLKKPVDESALLFAVQSAIAGEGMK